MEKSQVYSKLKYVRSSVKKVAPVLDLVRGKSVAEASRVLAFDHSKGAKLTLKALKTAIADATNSHKLNEDDLFISEIWAGAGPTFKRGHFVGRGHYSPILKRTCHINVGLSERKKK